MPTLAVEEVTTTALEEDVTIAHRGTPTTTTAPPIPRHGCQMAKAGFLESYVFGPSGLKDYGSATLHCKI